MTTQKPSSEMNRRLSSKRLSKQQKTSRRQRFFNWLERRFCVPEFAGGMLMILAGFFFIAATNTLAGWLYVISGVSFALLLIGAAMPARFIQEVTVTRSPIAPVSVGDEVYVEVLLKNTGKTDKLLLEVQDALPSGLSNITQQAVTIEQIAAHQEYRWDYTATTTRRGVYCLNELDIATASPFGLFRSRRSRSASQTVIVYPTVLPLNQCPLLDRLGRDTSLRQYSPDHTHNNATEGLTKTLRPYRWGDPTRLIHWRTSARFGELRVRELETTIGGQEVAIALDTSSGWQEDAFEEAAIAAASLYFYAQKINLNVRLWTAVTGLEHGRRNVLETLAAARIGDSDRAEQPEAFPDLPLVWLTHRTEGLDSLPQGSRWLLWQSSPTAGYLGRSAGMAIEMAADPTDTTYRSLQSQLQARLSE